MAMLKDNHLSAMGGGPDSVLCGVEMIRELYGPYVNIEVEVEDIPCGLAAVEAGAEIIMLDNFSPEAIQKAASEIRKTAEDQGRDITLEASGGIDLDNLEKYAPHVDVISMGALTYDADPIGFKMEFHK
jgi:nicotinate-nucleotide pyrophosphorylase (carboxylating)